jgi:hypothetical protein
MMYQVKQQDKVVFQSSFFVDAWLFAKLNAGTTVMIVGRDGQWKIDPALTN